MQDWLVKLADYLQLPISTLLLFGALWKFFKTAILNEIKKQTEKDLILLQSECNKEVLEKLENQKADLQKDINTYNSKLEHKVLSAIEDQKADIQKKLNEQMADFQVAHTRYSYIKREEINAYRIFYGKLLKAYYKFRHFALRKNDINVYEMGYGFFEEHILNFDIPNQMKEEVLRAIKNKEKNAQILFDRAQIVQLHYSFRQADKEQEEYFMENELFFYDEICLSIRQFQNRMDDLNLYYGLALGQSYEMAGALCVSMFGKLMNEAEFRKDVDDLSKDLDVIKELIKKEIHEH